MCSAVAYFLREHHQGHLASLCLSSLLSAAFAHPCLCWFPAGHWRKDAPEASAAPCQDASPPAGPASLAADHQLDAGAAPDLQTAHDKSQEHPEEGPGGPEEDSADGADQGPPGDPAGGAGEPGLHARHGELEDKGQHVQAVLFACPHSSAKTLWYTQCWAILAAAFCLQGFQ